MPVLGSVIGALVGSFAGAMLFGYSSSGTAGTAVHAGWGALLGRVAATTAKITVGIVMAVGAFLPAPGDLLSFPPLPPLPRAPPRHPEARRPLPVHTTSFTPRVLPPP